MEYKEAAFKLGYQHALADSLKLSGSAYANQIEQQGSWTRGGTPATASPTPQTQVREQPPPTQPQVAQAGGGGAPPANQSGAQQMQRSLRSQAMEQGNRYAKNWYGWGESGR